MTLHDCGCGCLKRTDPLILNQLLSWQHSTSLGFRPLRLIPENCWSDCQLIQSHLPLIQLRLVYDTTIRNTLPIEELVIWIRLLLQFCSDFGELDECLAQRYSMGLIIRGRLFALLCAVSRRVADASHFCNPPLQRITENCAVLQPKNFPTEDRLYKKCSY
jgi:hypothetical protein